MQEKIVKSLNKSGKHRFLRVFGALQDPTLELHDQSGAFIANLTVGSNTFQVSYEGGDGNDLALTVVP